MNLRTIITIKDDLPILAVVFGGLNKPQLLDAIASDSRDKGAEILRHDDTTVETLVAKPSEEIKTACEGAKKAFSALNQQFRSQNEDMRQACPDGILDLHMFEVDVDEADPLETVIRVSLVSNDMR